MHDVLEIFNIFNLPLLSLLPMGCLVASSHLNQLLFAGGLPILLSLLNLCLYTLARACGGARVGDQPSGSLHRGKLTLSGWAKANCLAMELGLLFFLFPSLTSITFRTFICREFDGVEETYLTADLGVLCGDAAHDTQRGVAGGMALMYCVGIPVLFASLLVRKKSSIHPGHQDEDGDDDDDGAELPQSVRVVREIARREEKKTHDRLLRHIAFLYGDYKPAAWWYELFIMGRKLFMNGALVFVYEGSATQIVVAELVSFLSLGVLYHVDPYIEPSSASLAVIAQWAEIFVLYGALLCKIRFSEAEGRFFSAALISVLVLPLIISFVGVVLGARHEHRDALGSGSASTPKERRRQRPNAETYTEAGQGDDVKDADEDAPVVVSVESGERRRSRAYSVIAGLSTRAKKGVSRHRSHGTHRSKSRGSHRSRSSGHRHNSKGRSRSSSSSKRRRAGQEDRKDWVTSVTERVKKGRRHTGKEQPPTDVVEVVTDGE